MGDSKRDKPTPSTIPLLWPIALLACTLAAGPSVWGQNFEPLGDEFQVNSVTIDGQYDASVAVAANGDFIVVWDSFGQDGWGVGVFGQRFASSGAPLGTEFQINNFTSSHESDASVASDAEGDFVVVWESLGDGWGTGVFGQRFASSGVKLGTVFQVNTYTSSGQDEPSVAVAANGDFIVAWESLGQERFNDGVFAQRFASSGAPLGTEFQVNTYTTRGQSRPSVAADANGNFIVVWESHQDGSSYGVFGQRFASSGAPLGTEFQINSYTSDLQVAPAVAVDAAGGFIVAWESYLQDGSFQGIFAQRYDSSGTALGAEFQVNTYTTGYQRFASVAVAVNGNFIIVWESNAQDDSRRGVFGRHFTADGAPLGTEFQINSFTRNHKFKPLVSTDADNDFVVVWTSSGQDGSSHGVFGQRFSLLPPVVPNGFLALALLALAFPLYLRR